MRRGACPLCGAANNACGTSHALHVIDVPERTERGPGMAELKNYRVTSPSGYVTTLRLSAAAAKAKGLTDRDLLGSSVVEGSTSDASTSSTETGAATPTGTPVSTASAGARNKARTAANKDGGDGGDPPERPDLSADVDDVSQYKVAEVTEYLAGASEAERARILGLELARGDKARSTITEWTPAPAQPDA